MISRFLNNIIINKVRVKKLFNLNIEYESTFLQTKQAK